MKNHSQAIPLSKRRKKRLQKQIEKFLKALQNDRDNYNLYIKLGDSYALLEEVEESVKYYYSAIDILRQSPKPEEIRNLLIELYEKIIKIAPNEYKAYIELSEEYIVAGRKEKAFMFLLSSAKKAYESENYELALQCYNQTIAKGRTNPHIVERCTELYIKLGREKEAIENYIHTGDMYAQQEKNIEALEYYKKASALDEENPELMLKAARMYNAMAWTENAAWELVKVGKYYEKRENITEALRYYRYSARLDPENEAAQDGRKRLSKSYTGDGISPTAIPLKEDELVELAVEEASLEKEEGVLGIINRAKNTKVANLILSDKDLNELPPEIGELTNLSTLDLRSNRLTTLPSEIGQLMNLAKLFLGKNRLTTLPPEIGQLTKLSELDVSNNHLSTLPLELGQLKLTKLELRGNSLPIPPEILERVNEPFVIISYYILSKLPLDTRQCRTVTNLNLVRTQLSMLPREIGQLTKLTVLSLRENQLSTLPPEIGQIMDLTGLDVGVNQLGTLPPEIGLLTKLTKLSLRENQLRTLPSEFGLLTKLTTLSLRGNQLSTLPPEIGQLLQLTVLDLQDNKLSTLPPEIGLLTKLVELFLGKNRLATLPLELGQLKLTKLDLRGNLLPIPPEILKRVDEPSVIISYYLLSKLPLEPEQCRKVTKLNLVKAQLRMLPREIGQLTELTVLSLRENQLSTLPPEIGQLTKLTKLDLSKNRLQTLPPEIGQLTKLRKLDLRGNPLPIPPEILERVDEPSVIISYYLFTTYPSEIKQLTKLRKFDLRNIQLNKLPPEIGQFTQLIELDLSDNLLTMLPSEIGQLTKLRKLDLRGNPLPIPPEILERVDEPSIIIGYYLQHFHITAKKPLTKTRPLREAKVLLVGQGGVGKTQIVNRLLYNTYNENEPKTDGIDIHKWQTENEDKKIKLNIWDFGGQEIMHATHQFFLTKRSLYLLVWDARQEDRYGQIDYWLKLIQSFGADSPVVIILNKIDAGKVDLDRQELSKKYPNIKDFIRISCKTGQDLYRLKAVIAREISHLKHIDDQLLDSWFEVKTQLEKMTHDYIEYREYEKMCEAKEIDKLGQETLIGFLHDLGTVLNFKEDLRLRDVNILNPEWVTNAVYQILNYEPLKENGILESNTLNKILDSHKYPSHKHQFILDMMKKFEICFELEENKNTFLIPELLPTQSPNLDLDYQNGLGFQYHYNFFPMSVISRFIVRMHSFLFKRAYWKSGIALASTYNKALVKADRDERKIYIWVTGRQNTRRTFLAKIRAEFDHIHRTIPKIEAEEKVPLPENPDVVVNYQYLLDLEEMGEKTFVPTGLKKRANIKQLLEGVRYKKSAKYRSPYELLSEKIKRLRKAIVIETDPEEKFRLEKKLEEAENEREELEQKM